VNRRGNVPPGATTQVQFKIDLNELPTAGCPICGCQIFASTMVMYKQLGKVQHPQGIDQLVRVKLDLCQDCGALVQPVGLELKLVEVQQVKPNGGDKSDEPA